jgi:hypothetical protein
MIFFLLRSHVLYVARHLSPTVKVDVVLVNPTLAIVPNGSNRAGVPHFPTLDRPRYHTLTFRVLRRGRQRRRRSIGHVPFSVKG